MIELRGSVSLRAQDLQEETYVTSPRGQQELGCGHWAHSR